VSGAQQEDLDHEKHEKHERRSGEAVKVRRRAEALTIVLFVFFVVES
jgi:hypothetical protein